MPLTTTTTTQETSAPTTTSGMPTSLMIGTTMQTQTISDQSLNSSAIATINDGNINMSSTTTTSTVESSTLVVVMPTVTVTPSSDDNTALIGGIVGGIVALFLIVGVIAFFVSRNRTANARQQVNDGHSLQESPTVSQPSDGIYDRVTLDMTSASTRNEYDDVSTPLTL